MLRPIIVDLINELLYEKLRDNSQYRIGSKGVTIFKNWFFEEILNNPPKKD